jgi:hypothetical protein
MLAVVLSFSALAADCSAGAATGVSPESSPPTLGVMLRFEHPPSSSLMQLVEKKIRAAFRPSGLDLRWEVLEKLRQPNTYNRSVIMEMRGRCVALPPGAPAQGKPGKLRLGWTIINDGEVLPYCTVDCDQAASVVSMAVASGALSAWMPETYGRLLARAMTHELLHALLRRADHSPTDCRRWLLSGRDLHVDGRLAPEEITELRRLGRAYGRVLAQHDGPAQPETALQ